MQGDNPISWLMFFTLAATVFIIAGAFIYFLRSQRNREIAAEALVGDNSRIGATPNGAAPELIGFAAITLAVMALLAAGYARKSSFETAQMTGPVGQTTPGQPSTSPQTTGQTSGQRSGAAAGTSPQGMAQPAGTADAPKVYQPANPAPDTRSAPTQSDTGIGNANGSTGQPK
ncbi:MAG: hypothetical protein JWR89_1101 [Tardiphaga sp.]|uniref:hypothetical protein n=1 Tax=Tardiphaga sp. TaxID=1926292 RepID=UPI0026270E6E|nr:hypothetical protein [Tardiphaga sp.]MDB5501199.1 hypothetical protein [Tardiphaga sp.]